MWRGLIAVLFLCLFFESSEAKQPHIVFCLADDYGFHDIGYHGSEIKTPNLDRLASEGVRLENYYVQPICTPSRSQFISGRYQIHTGLQHRTIQRFQRNALPLNSPTIADKLRQAGYATHLVGKWHLGFYNTSFIPINRGFDTFYGLYLGHGDHFNHSNTWTTGVNYLDLHDQDKPDFKQTGRYSTHLFTDKAINLIKNRKTHKPMFLYLAYQAPHDPLEVPDSYLSMYAHINSSKRKTYAAMVTAMDEGVGNVTQALKDAGMWKDTVFVFSTDNGGAPFFGANNYPLRGWKRGLWEGGIRAIGFVNAANLSKTGIENKALIHISDWYPTFVGLAGGSLNDTLPLDGYDQWKTISENSPSPRDELLINIDPLTPKRGHLLYQNTFDHRTHAALRSGDWKLITGNPGKGAWTAPPDTTGYRRPVNNDLSDKNLWLFNITADPTEEKDVSKQNPKVVIQMLKKLENYYKSSVPVNYPGKDPKSNPHFLGGVWGPWL